MRTFLLQLSVVCLLFSCSLPQDQPKQVSTKDILEELKTKALLTQDPYWQRRWWLEKTVRLFRAGEGFRTGEDPDVLLKLNDDKIVQKLIDSPEFAETVLGFNLFFWGQRTPVLRIPNQSGQVNYAFEVSATPSALYSAQEVAKNGDFLKLLDLNDALYQTPIKLAKDDDQAQLSDEDFLELMRTQLNTSLDAYSRKVIAARDLSLVCQSYYQDIGMKTDEIFLFRLSLSNDFYFEAALDQNWYGGIQAECRKESPSKSELLKKIAASKKYNDRLIQLLPQFLSKNYEIKNLKGLKYFDSKSLELTNTFTPFGLLLKLSLSNSSTNMNRKRSAFMLKRFFCDDLTPVGVENPKDHTDGEHGSNPACYSCHYKLDPMAGFFRTKGKFFFDYANDLKIIFDDDARMDAQSYYRRWSASSDSGREWNVGYIRSVQKESMNDYGESFEDLHKILRKAPEVKRCIVKRMAEYTIGEEQTMDGGYLDHLTENFKKYENSTRAVKEIFKSLALSESFRNPNAASDQCYDFKPGYNPVNAPPCRVSSIVQNNCVKCHSSVYGPGNLSLGEWITLPDGSKNFAHEDNFGKQFSTSETMTKIIARLTSSDENIRMPYKTHMSSQERQELYLWAQSQLQSTKRHPNE
ncbi:MAG: hypothetical protein M9962_05830 [Oligoflexia bacterium]|nr:hypothetical protein [Oligoflexia bacterium]